MAAPSFPTGASLLLPSPSGIMALVLDHSSGISHVEGVVAFQVVNFDISAPSSRRVISVLFGPHAMTDHQVGPHAMTDHQELRGHFEAKDVNGIQRWSINMPFVEIYPGDQQSNHTELERVFFGPNLLVRLVLRRLVGHAGCRSAPGSDVRLRWNPSTLCHTQNACAALPWRFQAADSIASPAEGATDLAFRWTRKRTSESFTLSSDRNLGKQWTRKASSRLRDYTFGWDDPRP
jgi:hypothetical protein